MELNYFYKKNPKIYKLLSKLEVLKEVIQLLPQLPHVEENLRRKSLLKSSLFSARIEGNKLRLEDIQYINTNLKSASNAKREIFNILGALRWVLSDKSPKKMSIPLILKLHKLVMTNLSPSAGFFRTEPSAIFNQAGVAIYLTPPPDQILPLINKLIKKTNSSKEPGPINSAICHYIFENIHPFLDGNGRVGRLLSAFVLAKTSFSFRGLVSLEEYLEYKRQDYYDLLAGRGKDITDFVEFFLEGLCIQGEKAIEGIKNVNKEDTQDRLLPRRQEILSIIKDHKMVSFDFIKRRFMKIPVSSLHYDLKQLTRAGFIKKLGSTRGVAYVSNE